MALVPGLLCHKSSLSTVRPLLSGRWLNVCCCALFLWNDDQGNYWTIAGIYHEKDAQSHLSTCCDAGSRFQSRVADRRDHDSSEELCYLCKFLFLSFGVSHFARLLFRFSLVRLLIPLSCMPGLPWNLWLGCNRGCCHIFSLWNGWSVILPLFLNYYYLWKCFLQGQNSLPAKIYIQPARVCHTDFRQNAMGFPWKWQHFALNGKLTVILTPTIFSELGVLLWPVCPSQYGLKILTSLDLLQSTHKWLVGSTEALPDLLMGL